MEQPSRGRGVGEAETEAKGLARGSHLSLTLKALGLWAAVNQEGAAPVPQGGLAGEDRPRGCPSLEGAVPAPMGAPKPRSPSPQAQLRGAGPAPVAAALGPLPVPRGENAALACEQTHPAGPSGSP